MGIVEFKNVSFGYENNRKIINNVTFSMEKGESVGIVGQNGAGKSTLMKLLLGLETDFDGEILVDNIGVCKKTLREIRKKVGYVFQNSDNQLFMPNVYREICFGPENYGFSKDDVRARAVASMEKVGCRHLEKRAAYTLSGGEKKLVAIATILALEPEVIVMDEPESNLDPMNRRRLVEIVKEIQGSKLIASHDLDFVWETTDRVLLLGDGEVKAFGKTKDVLCDEELLNRYSLLKPNCAIIEELKSKLYEHQK